VNKIESFSGYDTTIAVSAVSGYGYTMADQISNPEVFSISLRKEVERPLVLALDVSLIHSNTN